MMHISEFSKMCGTTVKTLRHYDRLGILLPDYVSPETGYRYYRRSTAERYRQIFVLRETGLTLREIGDYLDGNRSVTELLDDRIALLQRQSERCKAVRQLCEAQQQAEKPFRITSSNVWTEVLCCETGEVLRVKATAACKRAVDRLLNFGLNETQLVKLDFSNVCESLSGHTACATGSFYSADCGGLCPEEAIAQKWGEQTCALLLHFSCVPGVQPEMLDRMITDVLLSFQEGIDVLFSADMEGSGTGIFLEWVCFRRE